MIDIRSRGNVGSNTAIIRAIIALGKGMGYSILAEGVETVEQKRFLEQHGCDEMQGFYFAQLLPVETASKRLGLIGQEELNVAVS